MPTLTSDPVFGMDTLDYARTTLSAPARESLARLRHTLVRDVSPLLDSAWDDARMPPEVLRALIPLQLMQPTGVTAQEALSSMFSGWRNYVLARTDASVATLYNAQSGLFRTAVRRGASAERVTELDRQIVSFGLTGAFALTEPDHGSDIAGGLATTARRDGREWVLNGEKRWIGGADTADVLAVFARDTTSEQITAFLVPRVSEGVSLTTIRGKVGLRLMQNAHITLTDVRIPESARLERIASWNDVAGCLRAMRSDVAWIATGIQAGVVDAALAYVKTRRQFRRTLGSFQLVQEKIARMIANLTASLGMVVGLSRHQDAGHWADENSAMAKMWTSLRARETVALGREVLGGNGLLVENAAARFFADAEAVYSYEGTHEINALIVGRAATGVSAFT